MMIILKVKKKEKREKKEKEKKGSLFRCYYFLVQFKSSIEINNA